MLEPLSVITTEVSCSISQSERAFLNSVRRKKVNQLKNSTSRFNSLDKKCMVIPRKEEIKPFLDQMSAVTVNFDTAELSFLFRMAFSLTCNV